jgi:site-specific DNA-methyltransferase (adenine-specific)
MVKELALVEQLVNLTSSSPPKEVTANAQPYTPLTPLTHGGDEWETPKWVFDEWSAREGPFDLDPAATPANAKCPKYFTKKEHGLKRKWKGKVWLNPPYSEIDLWLQKARASAEQGALVVCLVPVWTDRPWWHEHVEGKAEVHFLTGRVKFVGAKGTAPFASAVIIYRP